jgi:hypothetical protein
MLRSSWVAAQQEAPEEGPSSISEWMKQNYDSIDH